MNLFIFSVICIIALVFVIIGYHMLSQRTNNLASFRRREIVKYIAVLDSIEELLGNAHHIPFSDTLLMCLNKKILETLTSMHAIEPSDDNIKQRISEIALQIHQLETGEAKHTLHDINVPRSDRDAVMLLKLVKRLRAVVKLEYTRGKLATNDFVEEDHRLEIIQMTIHIENVLHRAESAVAKSQLGLAKQLLLKARDVIGDQTDTYSTSAIERIQIMLTEIQDLMDQNFENSAPKKAASELDELFAPKKKW